MDNSRIFLDRKAFSAELKALWRVLIFVIVVQIVAGVAVLESNRYGFWFADFWFGATAATPLGLMFGLVWQLNAIKDTWSSHKAMIVFLGILSFSICAMAFLLPLEQLAARGITGE